MRSKSLLERQTVEDLPDYVQIDEPSCICSRVPLRSKLADVKLMKQSARRRTLAWYNDEEPIDRVTTAQCAICKVGPGHIGRTQATDDEQPDPKPLSQCI